MSLTKWAGFACGAASLTLSSVGHAGDIAADDVNAKISALEQEVARLKAQQGSDWLTEERAEQVRGLVNDVLADADTRASLLQSGMSAGYDNGFYLGSSDGNWSMTMNGWMQVRHVYNSQDESDDDNEWGFENTRTKLIFSGNVVDPSWTYRIESNFDRGGSGHLGLDAAWIRWDYGDGWGVKAGQFRLPVTRENMIYGVHQLAVERSNVDYIFGPGFSQGIMAEYAADQMRFWVAYSDGYGGGRSGFSNSTWDTPTTEYAFTGRFEYMASGNWDQFADFTSPAGDETGVLLGIAGHIEDGASGTIATETEYSLFTVDAQVEFGGANLFAAFIYRNMDDDTDDSDQYGFVIQGGVAFNEDWEGFLRYEYVDFDNSMEDLSLLTVGVNRYFAGHNLKWTTDIVFGIDELEQGAISQTGTQLDASGEDGQVAIRTQLQLLF